MKSESNKTLLWGTIVAVALVAGQWVLATRFSGLRMPVTSGSAKFGVVTAMLLAVVVFAYRPLSRRIGFWLLFFALLAVHTTFYVLFFSDRFMRLGHLQGDMLYGIIAAIEFVGFALIIARIYRVGPNIKWL